MLTGLLSLVLQLFFWLPHQLIRWLRRMAIYRRGAVLLSIDAKNAETYRIGGRGLEQLKRFAEDDDLRILAIEINALPSGWASLQALRGALCKIREADKKLWVHLLIPTRAALYIGTAAEKVWMLPSGFLIWNGLGSRISFYGELFARFGLKADIEAAGDYKSFGEPYSRSFPTTPNRQQLKALLTGLQNNWVSELANSRQLDPAQVLQTMNQSPFSAEQATDVGLIDGSLHVDEFRDMIAQEIDSKPLSAKSYDRQLRWEQALQRLGKTPNRIAVLHLNGAVLDSGPERTGIKADIVVANLEELAENPSVKAVVLAVNSPGGSAVASDRISRAVELLGRKKPVVAFFADVAASGGYYLASFAQEIVAHPNCITGSIGVIGGKLVVGKAMEDLGVRSELISVGPDSDYFSLWSPFSEDQRRRFRVFLQQTYQRFLLVVSSGRKLPMEAVEKVAGGRVWTGEQALEHGLIDQLGGLDVAIQRAFLKAKIPANSYRVWHLRERHSFSSRIRKMIGVQQATLFTPAWQKLPPVLQLLHHHPLQPLLLMPWDMEDGNRHP